MKLLLVQHGDCVDKEIDPERPLNEKGKAELKHLGRFLEEINLDISSIVHSTKLRSKQSALILAEILSLQDKLREHPHLEPMDEIADIIETIKELKGNTLIVGHLPFLTKLVSKLVIDDENNAIVSFEPGSLVCLEGILDKTWIISFMIKPSLLF